MFGGFYSEMSLSVHFQSADIFSLYNFALNEHKSVISPNDPTGLALSVRVNEFHEHGVADSHRKSSPARCTSASEKKKKISSTKAAGIFYPPEKVGI